jgi:hypothetical protein
MTIDEALVKIRDTQRCFVVWNSETGEILSVSEMNPHPDGKELFSRLESMGDHGLPVKSRYFDSSSVTRQVLEKEQAETVRIKMRVHILTQWAAASAQDLLHTLETAGYSYPMARDHDSRIIVDHLWRVHRDELTNHEQERLRALIGSESLSDRASWDLQAYLLALRGDEEGLLGLWTSGQQANLGQMLTLMDCFSHLNTRNQTVINDLIGIVEKADLMFHPRYQAMMTLGRLQLAQPIRAADAVRASVYASTPEIVAARDTVLARLSTASTEWERCSECCYGWIHSPRSRGESECPNCFGLGLVHTV